MQLDDTQIYEAMDNGNVVSITPDTKHYAFALFDTGNLVVGVRMDGSVEFGPGVSLDEASKVFWYGVAKHQPRRSP